MINLLTISDIEKRLHISHSTAYKLLKVENFPYIKIGKNYFIPEDKFEQWIADHMRQQINI